MSNSVNVNDCDYQSDLLVCYCVDHVRLNVICFNQSCVFFVMYF